MLSIWSTTSPASSALVGPAATTRAPRPTPSWRSAWIAGVTVIKVEPDDRVLAFLCTTDKEARLELETSKGKKLVLSPTRYEVSARGGRGREMARKETLKLLPAPLRWTPLPEEKKEER